MQTTTLDRFGDRRHRAVAIRGVAPALVSAVLAVALAVLLTTQAAGEPGVQPLPAPAPVAAGQAGLASH
jgi:hypothetical protein